MLTLDGVYRNGRIELSEEPVGVEESRVKVTFLSEKGNSVESRRIAGARLLEDMRQGLSFESIKFQREDVYNERLKELESRRANRD